MNNNLSIFYKKVHISRPQYFTMYKNTETNIISQLYFDFKELYLRYNKVMTLVLEKSFDFLQQNVIPCNREIGNYFHIVAITCNILMLLELTSEPILHSFKCYL